MYLCINKSNSFKLIIFFLKWYANQDGEKPTIYCLEYFHQDIPLIQFLNRGEYHRKCQHQFLLSYFSVLELIHFDFQIDKYRSVW